MKEDAMHAFGYRHPRRAAAIALLGSAVVLGGACSSSTAPAPHAEIARQLAEARERWRATGLDTYGFTMRRSCFCPPPHRVSLIVREGRLSHVADLETGEGVPPESMAFYRDVEGLFDMVAQAVERDAARLEVTFDPQMGYPSSVSIDFRFEVADDEWSAEVLSPPAELLEGGGA
ncbi:MAG: hypothetical protein D6701_05130 [Gemmatimonadetes bacterium]|nr:MAG: hypothetical protein D6701_05130 [Gemmatimonadota bacterium]